MKAAKKQFEMWCLNCDRLMVDHDNNISVCINYETRVIMKSVSQDLKPAEELIQTMSEIDKIINDRLRDKLTKPVKSCDDGGCSIQ